MMVPPIPPAMFGATPATAEWMERHCNPQALNTFSMPALLQGAGQALPKTFILADGWDASPFRHFARLAEQDPAWQTATLSGGHGLMMDQPRELSELLHGLSR